MLISAEIRWFWRDPPADLDHALFVPEELASRSFDRIEERARALLAALR